MRNFIKYLFLLAAIIIWQSLKAADNDSGLVRARDYIAQKIERQIKENEERAKKGLPKNFIVFADARELSGKQPNDEVNHVITARQSKTTEETIKGLWNFEKNTELQKLSQKLNDFAAENKYEYYVVVAAIYNIDENQTETTDFSKVTWQDIDGISTTVSPVHKADETKALQWFTTNGQDKFNKLAGWIYNKVSPLKSNALYHFVITTYFPLLPDKADAMVGRVAHLQTIINADPTQNSIYNDAFVNYWQTQAQHKSATPWTTKEHWLLSAADGIQDFIATIRNFKESDLLAINTPITMLQHLKALEKPDVILSGLSFSTREHIIKVLNQLNELDDDYWLPKLTNGGENAMLAVIKTTPGKDADKLTELLKKDSYQILKDLNTKFDDAGIFGTNNNYTKFVQALTNVMVAGLDDKKLDKIVENGRVFNLLIRGNDKKLVNFFSNDIEQEYNKQVNTGSGSFQRKVSHASANLDDITKYWITTSLETTSAESMPETFKAVQDATNVEGNIDLHQFDEKAPPVSSVELGPFDMMLVVPQKDFDINGFTLTKNDFQPIPMYYYYWLSKKHENDQWIWLGQEAGDALLVVSMLTGIGEILEGGKLATQAIRAARVLFDAKMLLNSASDGGVDEWLREKLGEGGFRIYRFIEYTYLIYTTTKGGIVLASKVGPILSRAVTSLFELVVNTPELIASLKTTNYYAAFRTYFKNVLGKDLEAVVQAGGASGNVVANSILPWQSFASRIKNDYPKIYAQFQEWGSTLKQQFTNQYNKLRGCLIAFDENPDYLDVWEAWMTGYKIKVSTWAEAVKETDALIKPTIKQIKEIYDDLDLKIGYRGSLSKGVKSDGKPFDPKDWDADAFIVSNELAAEFKRGITWRDAKQLSPKMAELIEKLEDQLIHLEGIRFEPDKPFTFRVWTEAEFIKEVAPNGYKLF